jgi:hypothetical protein
MLKLAKKEFSEFKDFNSNKNNYYEYDENKKVNLNIANEMSTYEGNRDAEIINITPELKNEPIEMEQGIEIENLCKQKGIEIATICKVYKIDTIIHLPVSKFAQVIETLNSKPDAVKEEVVNANN